MGGGASIPIAATENVEDKVRLSDVADAHYRRELSKVFVREYSKIQLNGLEGADLEAKFETMLRTEQHKIRAEVSTAVVQSVSRELQGISETTIIDLDYKHLCSEAINEMRDKNSYNFLLCIDGSELGDIVLNNSLNLRKKNDILTVFHASKNDEKIENYDYKSTVLKSKVETRLISTLLPKFYSLCFRAREEYEDGSVQSVRDSVIQLLNEYRIYKYTHSLAYSKNSYEVFTLPTTKQPDFLVLGHLGRKGVSKHNNELTTLGSTADITLKSAHIPCILMKKLVTTSNKFYCIAVDNSELSKVGLDILLTIVKPRDKLRIIHVFDTNSLTDENLNILKDYYVKELDNFGPSDAEVVVLTKLNGNEIITDIICNWIEENSPDYFAITPKARDGNDLSSLTASMITRAPCNVILLGALNMNPNVNLASLNSSPQSPLIIPRDSHSVNNGTPALSRDRASRDTFNTSPKMLEEGLELVAGGVTASGKVIKFDNNSYSSLPLGSEEKIWKSSSTIHCNTINVTTGTNTGASYDNNSPKDIEEDADADSAISDQMTSSLRMTRKNKRFESWKGDNKFWCNGGLMSGVHSSHMYTSCLLLFFTSVAYIIGIAPFLQSVNSIYVELFLYLINMTTLLLTSFTDPGIVPRYHASSMLSDVYMELKNTEVNFCNICHIFRPDRAKHCRHCDVCIDVFDHHCPWTGTCIGIRNYKYFLAFVFTVLLNTIYCLVSIVYLVIGWSYGMKTDQYILRLAVVVIMGAWLLVIMSLLTILFIFHVNLILRKQTTLEYLRQCSLSDQIKIEYNKLSVPDYMLYSLFPICYPGNQCNNGYITHGPTTRLLPMWKEEDPVSDAQHDLEQMNQIKKDYCK